MSAHGVWRDITGKGNFAVRPALCGPDRHVYLRISERCPSRFGPVVNHMATADPETAKPASHAGRVPLGPNASGDRQGLVKRRYGRWIVSSRGAHPAQVFERRRVGEG